MSYKIVEIDKNSELSRLYNLKYVLYHDTFAIGYFWHITYAEMLKENLENYDRGEE